MTTAPSPHERVALSLARQGMMTHLGVRLLSATPGQVELALTYSDKLTQQQGGFHGGAIGALADIAAGYAALTVSPEGMEVTTVEYKINFLSNFQGGEIRATGRVTKAGKRIIVTSAEVVHINDNGQRSDFDKELSAQGVGNMLCGLVGALPMTGVIVPVARSTRYT